jgi:myo-inositol 2-dehydrogenase / D-chiro-inositol 1-dehydrogenase
VSVAAIATSVAPLRIGVIGVGRIGRMHAQLLAHDVRGAMLGTVYDVREALARDVAAALGVRHTASAEEILDGDIDAVAICSTADSHAELVLAAAEAGKAVFCEKPISLDLTELDHALSAVDAAGVPVQVGLNRRFDRAHAAVREAVVSGAIGAPHVVRITSRDPEPPPLEYVQTSGGLFLDMMIHDFDMARYVTGREVVEVFARGAVRVEPSLNALGDVDTAVVTLVHEDGCLTAIDNSRRAEYGYDQRVEVFGSAGMAATENPSAHTGLVLTRDGMHRPALPHFFLERYADSYVREWQAFVGAVQTGAPPPVSIRDARAQLVIALAALRSHTEGRPVRTAEVDAR